MLRYSVSCLAASLSCGRESYGGVVPRCFVACPAIPLLATIIDPAPARHPVSARYHTTYTRHPTRHPTPAHYHPSPVRYQNIAAVRSTMRALPCQTNEKSFNKQTDMH